MNPIGIFLTLLQALEYIIIADALLSWVVPNPEQFPRSFTTQIVDPLCAPFRKLLSPERTGGFDLSPLLAILVLRFMGHMLTRSL